MTVTALEYLGETAQIIHKLDAHEIERVAYHLRNLKGRLFLLGNGGSAATASHAVNDFRKIAGIEAYTPTDNVAELTARTNDDGWQTTYHSWLATSRLRREDAVMVISVGGGAVRLSPNITNALGFARARSVTVLGVVGRDGGRTAYLSDACVIIPPLFEERITPHTEGIASVILHLLVEMCRKS